MTQNFASEMPDFGIGAENIAIVRFDYDRAVNDDADSTLEVNDIFFAEYLWVAILQIFIKGRCLEPLEKWTIFEILDQKLLILVHIKKSRFLIGKVLELKPLAFGCGILVPDN